MDDHYDQEPLPADVQAYLHIVKQVTVIDTDHGCMITMKREIAGQTFIATASQGQHLTGLDHLLAIVETLKLNIAHQVMEKL